MYKHKAEFVVMKLFRNRRYVYVKDITFLNLRAKKIVKDNVFSTFSDCEYLCIYLQISYHIYTYDIDIICIRPSVFLRLNILITRRKRDYD